MGVKRLAAAAVSALTAISLTSAFPMISNAENPIVQTSFTPDPAPVVIGDELYVFTGCDREGNNDFYYMTGWQCFSTKDMKNWTDHGRILEDTSFSWCNANDAWASQCIERNGKYYFYFTTTNKGGGGRAIGVAVADKPEGPYSDPLGKPLCGPNWDYIDPTVMIDDDGQAWLMFGNPKCYYVKLKEDMVTLDGQIRQFDMTAQAFGSSSKGTTYGEGPWICKHGDLYYLVYAAFVDGYGGESIAYSTGPSVTGPWTYRGPIQKGSNCFTTHGGIIDYKDHSYFFYHKSGIPGGSSYNRSAACEEFTFNADGTINPPTLTNEGPSQLESLNPYERVEAETICWSEGVKTEKDENDSVCIGTIKKGSYIKVAGVDFGEGADTFTACAASAESGGNIELHLDSKTGPIVGNLKVGGTGGWHNWEEVSCDVKGATGEHDLYLVFNGGDSYLMNVDWWKFSGAGSSEPTTTVTTTKPAEVTTTTSKKTESDTPATQTSADTGDYLIEYSFESSDSGWEGRGEASVSTSSKNAYKGSKSLYCEGRTAAWNGASTELGSSFRAGQTYSFSANILCDTGKNGDVFYFTMQYEGSDGEVHYEKIAKAKPMKGEWVQLANTGFTIPEGASDIHIYIETEKATSAFYVDDVKIAEAGVKIAGAEGRQYIIGDLNGDANINVFDVILGRKGLLKGFSDENMKTLADVDQSTEFELNDLVLLQNYVSGKNTEFPNNAPAPQKSDFNYNANLQVKDAPGEYLNPCSQAGKITKETYNGIRGTKSLNVYTPYNYDPDKKYNIFYLMHGGGENENTIFSNDVKMQNILDHMIMNGELEPLIVVTPTFNGTGSQAENFYEELRASVIPFVEGKYSTYAESTSEADIQASRMHRAYGGFSMGGGSTWKVACYDMDLVGYFMPLSGHNWDGVSALTQEIDKLGFTTRDYFIMACTGSEDIAHGNMVPQINQMKSDSHFVYTSDFSEGNFYFLDAPGRTHWWGYVRHYIYDALPYFFHEGQ